MSAIGYLVVKATGKRIPLDAAPADVDGWVDFELEVIRRAEPLEPPKLTCLLCGVVAEEWHFLPSTEAMPEPFCFDCGSHAPTRYRRWIDDASWNDMQFIHRVGATIAAIDREAGRG